MKTQFYKTNKTDSLSEALFRNPTNEYRGTPFWAWNCRLSKEELLWQIDRLKEMGFGGFHMHSRDGMATTYLSEDFFELVSACVEKAKKEKMLAYLYDEDKYPSGFGGGYVTKNVAYRRRSLVISPEDHREISDISREDAIREGKHYFVAAYSVTLNQDGTLKNYSRIDRYDEAEGDKWYAFCYVDGPSAWFNNETYVDTLNKEAVDAFINTTHEAYRQHVGDEFGKTVPSIFTDEPQFSTKKLLPRSHDRREFVYTWTPDLPETFEETYGEKLLERLPEVFWNLPEGRPSRVRYHFHDHICQRFAESYADNIGEWCDSKGLLLTGHVMDEHCLFSQANSVGEVMRLYRRFGIPGIDVLSAHYEFSTAKQCQSAKNQLGRDAMLSELYGVTNYDFDFRGYKLHGDWQAALGVTVRVPHLSWVSMEGCAKRDYPATFNYQSPWYRDFKKLEDHFARLNTALTRGKPLVKVAAIHPIESYWINFGPNDVTMTEREQIGENFENFLEYMLLGTVDFDFISESMLPELYRPEADGFGVGEMTYQTVVVPGCINLRRTTFDALRDYHRRGGRVLFVGECPKYVELEETPEMRELFDACDHADFTRNSILSKLSEERMISVTHTDKRSCHDFLYSMREDTDCRWLFLCRAYPQRPRHPHPMDGNLLDGMYTTVREACAPDDVMITIKGEYAPLLYDTMTGEIREIPYCHRNGNTEISRPVYYHDSYLFKLIPSTVHEKREEIQAKKEPIGVLDFKTPQAYTLDGDNVLLLDRADYRLDQGQWRGEEEILRLDTLLRNEIGLPNRLWGFAQPWSVKPEPVTHSLSLRFTVDSEIGLPAVQLALEHSRDAEITWNRQPVKEAPCGYYVDKSIEVLPLGALLPGRNVLELVLPLGNRTNTEYCYLLGHFGVKLSGCRTLLTEMPKTVGFGSITSQGFPFYSKNFSYDTQVEAPRDCAMEIRANLYRGALVKVLVDGQDCGSIFTEPYLLRIPYVKMGKHTVTFVCCGNMHNTFGSLHNYSDGEWSNWFGPRYWYPEGAELGYEYRLKDFGILASPVITLYPVSEQ